MVDIIKLQIKALEVKLTVARPERKKELEAKIKVLQGLVAPVAKQKATTKPDDAAAKRAERREARRIAKQKEKEENEQPVFLFESY